VLIVLKKGCTEAQQDRIVELIRRRDLEALPVSGPTRTAVCVLGNKGPLEDAGFAHLEGVHEVIRVTRPYKLVSREVQPESSVVSVGNVAIGGAHRPVVMAGPCSVEEADRTIAIAHAAREAGAAVLRGGAFKPRTSPYSFQGLGEEGLEILACARRETGLPVVSEVIDASSARLGARYLDALQIGARNMQNYALLRVIGRMGLPILLKRGLSATLEEWLMAAEYLLAEGTSQVLLCERGIRTFATHSRNTLDLNVVPLARKMSHLPVLVDPSHGVGKRDRVRPLARAALASGAHGLMLEVHTHPDTAYSDAQQTIDVETFEGVVKDASILSQLDPLFGP